MSRRLKTITETVNRAHARASNTDLKCPKCGGTEIDDQFELIYLGYGEFDCVNWDPVCAQCGHPLGDDWYDGKEDDFAFIYQSPYTSFLRRKPRAPSPRRKKGDEKWPRMPQ